MKNPFRRPKLSSTQKDHLPDVGAIYDKLLAAKTLEELRGITPDIKSIKELDPTSFLHLTIAAQLQALNIRVTALENVREK